MALETSEEIMLSLFEKLMLEEPWVPPRSWESLHSQIGMSALASSPTSRDLYAASAVSEPSLVRLAMNSLQGVESALKSIEKLSSLFCHDSADRTSHRIPSLWTWCASTSAVGYLLTSIGQFGCIIFLLHLLVDFFSTPYFDASMDLEENKNNNSRKEVQNSNHRQTLVNQAFGVSVRKVLDGYISALNTLYASVSLRRSSNINNEGCLTDIGHSEITILEVYLHTAGLRTQIEALGNICNVNNLSVSFPDSSLEDLKLRVKDDFKAFPRGADLLSFLYSQLKVADPDHCDLLKFLFLQTYEPYCGFIRSWIYNGRISDTYTEFIVEYVEEVTTHASNDMGIISSLPTIRERDGVSIPCFLQECVIPLFRTGQQLQIIMKLLELCSNIGTYDVNEGILPSLIGLSCEHPWFAFPLTFEKGTMEIMVRERANYYKKMLEKIDERLSMFEFNTRKASSQSVPLRVMNSFEKSHNNRECYPADNKIQPLYDGRYEIMLDNTLDSKVSSLKDEFSCSDDHWESSECSSSDTSEGQDEAEQQSHIADSKKPRHLDVLDFSMTFSPYKKIPNLYQNEINEITCFHMPNKIDDTSGSYPFRKETYPIATKSKYPHTPETQVYMCGYGPLQYDGYHADRADNEISWLPSCSHGLDISMRNYESLNTSSVLPKSPFMVNFGHKYQHPVGECEPSHTSNSQLRNFEYDYTLFCMKPTMNRNSCLYPKPLHGEICNAKNGDICFDFTSVKDPLKGYAEKLSSHAIHVKTEFENEPLMNENEPLTVNEIPDNCVDTKNHRTVDENSETNIKNNLKSFDDCLPLIKKESESLKTTSGAGDWESLLGSVNNTVSNFLRDQSTSFVAAVELPLDFVIKNCVLDEILLHYKYLSKLTIKLLVEGFKLQDHLVAMRRYHFMEIADWADSFITSLWHQKWHVNESRKRIPEIQGFLELSVQRSSCEGDPYKDRLFVFLKEEITSSINGIHSFDFLGLGYRVDWPVSIILTPAALNIYSGIFSFLTQLKIAVVSLTDAWLSLKSDREGQLNREVYHVSILTETRHKLNHFVSTFQQYVHSQLSQVSWCRFLLSLKHKVEDMLDLESVHMHYLTESLNICFLSNETQVVGSIIQKILQCAVDFQSCLMGHIWHADVNDEKLNHGFSEIDIMQILSIRKIFMDNLEELHVIYLQSPKHDEFGLSHFWDHLDYNEYYSEYIHKQLDRSLS